MNIYQFVAGCFLCLMGTAVLGQKTTIDQKNLPKAASTFISKNFQNNKVQQAYKDIDDGRTEYDVHLANGIEIEFDQDGNWKEVDGNHTAIPTKFLSSNIVSYVSKNYPKASIVKAEKNTRKIEIELSNGIDLEFDLKGNFIRVD